MAICTEKYQYYKPIYKYQPPFELMAPDQTQSGNVSRRKFILGVGAAGLGGASSEMVAKGGLGAEIRLEDVHQREPNMSALEILLAESQERMCYEIEPGDVDRVREVADRFDLGCSLIGAVTDSGRYVCTFEGETVVDVPAEYLADGAPMNDLPSEPAAEPARDLPEVPLADAFEAVLASPNTASKRWVYRQYDHEVGVQTAMRPGDDAAVLAVREAEVGLAISAGAAPNWTASDPVEGARAVALENATNLAAKGATPLAAVDCLNGGNPEKPDVYGGFSGIVDGLAGMLRDLDVPVVGGNVSLYNDSESGPVPPTPTLMVVGTREDYEAPPMALGGSGELLLVGEPTGRLGGSEYLAQFGGSDAFPDLPADPADVVGAIAEVANQESTLAVHDVSDGGLAVTLAEMVSEDAGVDADVPSIVALFSEAPGRAVVETTAPDVLGEAVDAPVVELGEATTDGVLSLTVASETVDYQYEDVRDARDVIQRELD